MSGHPGRRAAGENGAPDLELQVRRLLASEDRLGLLGLASSMLATLEPEPTAPMAREAPPELPPVADMVAMLAASGPGTGALAWAMALMSGAETNRAAVLGELLAGGHRLPTWVDRLDDVTVTRAVETVDTLRDAADVVLEVRSGPTVFSVVTLVDFNLGSVVKDAFAREMPLTEFERHWSEVVTRGDTSLDALPLADARTRLEQAIEWGSRTWPPLVSEEWPQSRPLLQWLLTHLPEGGTDFDRPRWSDRRRATLVRHFLESDLAPEPEGDDDESVADDLVWFRSDWGWGDPLRWSPTSVEILMLDWYPRKIQADAAYLRRMPEVLRGLVRFAQRRAKISRRLTADVIAAIDHFEPAYHEAVGGPRAQGPAALLERLGLDVSGLGDDGAFDDSSYYRASVAEQVGGDHALDAMDGEPLPDEEFRWEGVPEALRAPVAHVLERCDRACANLGLGVERRTAVRRLLRDVVDLRPAMFGRGSPATLAGAVLLLVDSVNEAEGRVRVDAILDEVGVRRPSTRMDTIRDALGTRALWPLSLGSPRYLTGAQRRYLRRLLSDDPDEIPIRPYEGP